MTSGTERSQSGEAHLLTSEADLDRVYARPAATSLVKEIDHISAHYRAFIEACPFVVVASVGPEGLDCSPRGDPAGFVRVVDPKTVMIPDRRGNNRIDTLRNIVRDPRVALLFLIPGVGETFRINGRAMISAEPALCESFAMAGKPATSVIVVRVERCYFQCRKALVRSRLWDPATHVDRASLPSAGRILDDLSGGAIDGEQYEADYPERMQRTIY